MNADQIAALVAKLNSKKEEPTNPYTLKMRPNIGIRAWYERVDALSLVPGQMKMDLGTMDKAREWIRINGDEKKVYEIWSNEPQELKERWVWDESRKWHVGFFIQPSNCKLASDKPQLWAKVNKECKDAGIDRVEMYKRVRGKLTPGSAKQAVRQVKEKIKEFR